MSRTRVISTFADSTVETNVINPELVLLRIDPLPGLGKPVEICMTTALARSIARQLNEVAPPKRDIPFDSCGSGLLWTHQRAG